MNKSKLTLILVAALLLLVGVTAVMAQGTASEPVSDRGITPYIIDGTSGGGNRTCEEVGLAFFGEADYYELTTGKVDYEGSEPGDWDPIKVTITDGTYVAWEYDKHDGLAAIVKGSADANVYVYDGSYTYDSGLASPLTSSGNPAELSNLTFCWNPADEELTVSKTAVTSFTREHFWDIAKSVATENEYMHDGYPKVWLYIDGSGNEKATWTVDVTYEGFEDYGFNVAGDITIENTGTLDAVITAVDDVLAGTAIDVDCGVTFPHTLLVGGTLTCTYSKDVDSKIAGNNEASVTTQAGFTYDAEPVELVWGEPTNEVNKTVTIEDNSDLFDLVVLGTVTAPFSDTFTYTKEFAWADYGADGCGDFVYGNTATIVKTGQTASATLKVNVQCYIYESAWAKGDPNVPFCDYFANWGWTNPIEPGTYNWPLWAGAGQCDTSKGTLVGTVTVVYDGTNVIVTYNVDAPYLLDETHVYAGYDMFPKDRKGNSTVAPGQYTNNSPFDGSQVYVIAHAVVGIPDPDFGP
jgi:hypothetical protein